MTVRFGTAPRVKLSGQWLTADTAPRLLSASVVNDLNGPGACDVVFSDPDRDILERLGADFGQEIEVHASAVEERSESPVFVGRIYGLEFQADESGCLSILRAYDATYTLRQRRAVACYNDVSDAELVRRLCSEAGAEVGTVEGGDDRQTHLIQLNETHWDFLGRRAAANGARLYAAGGKVHVRPIPEASSAPAPGDHRSVDPLQLTPGLNVLYLRARTTSVQLTEEVEVRGWDPAAKREVTARKRVATPAASHDSAPADVAGQHGTGLRVAGRPGLQRVSDCESLATSYAQRLANTHAYLEGKAYGDPGLSAGVPVAIGRTGRFDGRYTLTSTRHVFDQDGYFTYFTVSGEHDRTMLGLLAGGGATDGTLPGVYPAIVTNINDPDKLGRVRLKLPWLSDDFESGWSRVMQMGAGPDRGVLFLPEVDDEVLVSFLGGDRSGAVVIGGLFNGVDAAPQDGLKDAGDGSVDTRAIQSRVGHKLVFDDTGGSEKVTLETGDGKVSIVLDQGGGATVTVTASGDLSVTTDANATIEATRDLTIKAGGNLNLKATGTVKVEGATINLN